MRPLDRDPVATSYWQFDPEVEDAEVAALPAVVYADVQSHFERASNELARLNRQHQVALEENKRLRCAVVMMRARVEKGDGLGAIGTANDALGDRP